MNIKFLLFAILVSNISCQAQPETGESSKNKTAVVKKTAPTADSFDCNLHGLQLKGEMHWDAEKQMLFAIAAQGEDINGSSPIYRTFQVYTTADCNMISYTIMPENRDNKPYRLFPNTYEANNEVVCAQGYDYTFCYHVRRKEFLLPLIPKYLTPRSRIGEVGEPLGLATWGNYLFGISQGNGAFAYDLRERSNPRVTKAKFEYIDQHTRSFKQLFFVFNEEGQQIFIPQSKDGELTLQPLLKPGEEITERIAQDRQGGRFAIARTKADNLALVFDLQESKRLDLPKRLIETRDILDYLKQQYK